MFYTTPRLTSDSWYKEPSSDLGDEANWLEVAESAADSLLKSNSLLSGYWNLDKTYDDHIAKVKEITGKELRNPTSLTYGVYESDDERRRFNSDLAKYREDGGSLSDWGYSKQWREQEFRRQLGELAAVHPDKTSEIMPDMSFIEQSHGVARKAQDREHAVWERSGKGVIAWSASLAGGLWGSAQDPVNWITAPIGFSGVGTGAKGLAMGFLKAGTANAAVEAAVQPFVQSYRSEAGLDSGSEQAATAIGGAFLFGGALDTTVRGIARGLRYSFGYEPIIVNGVVRGYRKRGAAPAIADGAAPSAPGQAEPPPAVDIPAELLVRAEKNDRAAIEEIDRIIRGGDDTVITQRTVDQADAGDPKAIREIAEKTGVAGDPIARQSLDAMDANEMLRVKPSDRVPDVDHDAAIAQGLRHASDPEIEPPPVVRDGATPQAMSDIRDMVDDLRAEIKRLEDDVASRPDAKPPADMPDLRIKLAEAESSYRQMRRAIYDDGVIERVDAGDIPPDVADLVAAHVPDKAAQGRAIDDLMARNPGSAREARQMLSEMLASPDYRPDPVDTSPPPAGLKTKALDDPYGKEAAQQVDALKQKMSDELGIGKTQPTPEQQAAEIKAIVDRGDEVRKAIEDMVGLIPDGVSVKTFTALSDLPDSIRAEVEASNALLFADAVIRFQTARSTAERDAARRFLDMAKAGRGVEGIARGGTIWIATYAMNPRGSVAHEVLHVLRTMGKISPAEIKALAEFARNEGLFSPAREATYRKELARRGNAADVVSDILDEEAAAHAVEYRANLGRRLVEPPQVKTVLDRLAEFFAAIRDALKRKGFVAEGDAAPRTAATDVLEAFMSGEMIKRHGELAWMRSFMQAEDLTAVAVRNAAPQQVPRLSRPQQAPRLSRVTTPDGTATYDVEFEVVNLSDLKAATGDLQPRDRSTRAASTAQVQSMASKLNPELLIYSAQSDRGAPIIDENGVVLSGNGRVAAIRAARDMGASAYRDYVNRLASEGFDTSGAQQPVLVRRVKGLDNAGKREFAVKSNQDDKLAMAPAELARVDQDLMTDDVMMLLDADGDAGIAAAANRPFVRAVMGKLSPAQRGGLVGESGELTPAGVARLEAAIFARAYDDRALVNKIVEDQDGAGLRNALLGAAPAWAQMRAAAPKQFDVTKHLVEAVQTVVRMREQKIKPAEFFAQRDAFTQISPVTEGLVRSFYNEAGTRAAAWRTTRDLLKAYARIAADQANAVGDLMGAAPTPREIVEGQLRSRADEQTAMFAIAREQTNDGLTASEKKAKAERLGYDTGTVWYHGTRADFEAFNPKAVVDARAEKYGFYKNYPRMVFLADNADLPYSFAGGEGGRIMPLYIKKNLRLFDAAADADKLSGLLAERGKEINDLLTSPVGDLMSALERGSWQVMEAKPVQDWLRANGYDGFKAKTDFIAGKTTTIAGILDTSADGNIRSTNARFEPEQASSPNLMFAFADDKPVTPGLDMSHEARMKRAKEMGFDTDNVLFHGTSGDDFEKFTARHQTGGMGLPGVYMTPDANYAATYSGTADGSRIMPLFVRGKIASPAEYQAIWDSVYDNTGGRFSGPALTRLVQDEMLRRGYTGKSSLYENEWPVVVVFDPRNIRSVNAAFDPAKSDSANLMFAFAGERAKTADHDALALAKRMTIDGATREEVWTRTGWFQGVDGKWRFEIDDSGAGLNSTSARTVKMHEGLNHPDFFGAYPNWADDYGKGYYNLSPPIKYLSPSGRVLEGNAGVYRGYFDGIALDKTQDPKEMRLTALHELQHAIQDTENFADFRGGVANYKTDGWDAYTRAANEVEARLVEKRADMTASERRARPPWLDYDVPEEQQIVRFVDGVQNSEPLFSIRQDEPDAFDWGDRSTSGSRETKFGNTTITYGVQPRTKYAQVILVETAKADRGQGSAREAMKRFVAEADRNGFTVSLTAEPMGKGGMGKADLVKFYKSLGFVENKGRNKDFAVMAGMIRQPRNQPMFAMAQDQETGRSMRRDLDALGYYSGALEAAKNLRQAKGTPEQMLAMLRKEGAKQAELDAVNIGALLDGKVSVTKDEIVNYLDANRVGLKEVVSQPWQIPSRVGEKDAYIKKMEDSGIPDTRWQKHSLDPSNPTYRETVIHLPQTDGKSRVDVGVDAMNDIADMLEGRNAPGRVEDFRSGHFPEPNIIGHMQTSMVKHDGKPVYLIDQIQSDWGQKIESDTREALAQRLFGKRFKALSSDERKQVSAAKQSGDKPAGVRDEAKIAELVKRHTEASAAYQKADRELQPNPETKRYSDEDFKTLERLYNEESRLAAELNTALAATPGNPLVNTTDQWTTTTLRRALRQAAEADAAYIAIPSGDTVLSYNPGDTDGMRGFYGSREQEGIVPKNLRKLLEKLDKNSPAPVRVAELETPSGMRSYNYNGSGSGQFNKDQTGFTLFELTPAVKAKVKAEGQPLFALAMPQPKPSQGPFKTLLDQAREALTRVDEARIAGLSPVSDEIQDAITQAVEAITPLVEAARKAGLSDLATALPQYADQLRNAAPDDLVRVAAEVMQTTDIDAIARALDDAVMQRSQPMFAFRRDDGTQKPGGKTRAQMLQEDLAAIEAQFANASGDERKKLHAERAVLLNAEKLEERLDDLDRYRDHWNRRDTPMAAMFSVENTGQAQFHDLSSWRDEIMGRVERMISGPIWGWRKGAVTGDLRRTLNSGVKLNMHNFVREAAGESTKDPLAKEFAKSWLAATEYLRQRFNAAGGDIAKLAGWFMPQWHDADALIKAGREQWVEFILPLLDRKRVVDHDTGVPMADTALRTMLKEIWRTITSDGYNSLEIGDHMGRGALYKRHMEHRVLHFKDADSWLKYNNEYGGGDVYAAMISYISSMSRDIALMERFGANPELTWHRLKQLVIQEAKLAGPAKSLFDEFSGKIEELRAERKSLPSRIDELRDDLNTTLTTIDRLREEGKKSIRKENRNRGKISELSRDLPAKVKAIDDVLRSGDVQTPKQIELTNRIADLMAEMTEAGAYSVTSRNPVERAERLLQRADEMWKAFAGTTNTPISSTMAGAMSGARNWIGATTLVFAPFSAVTDQATQLAARSFIGMPATRQLASFVSGFTKGSREWALAQGFALDQAQAAFASQNRFVGWTNTRHLTGYIADRSHAFSLLSPMTQATKIGWYLDFTRWMGTLKDKEVIELPDDVQRLFDRHDISGSDWDAIRSAQLEDVNGMPGLTPLMVDKAVGEELASKYVRMIIRERKQAVVEPTLRGRTAFVSETRPGTPAGELLRSVAMLKSFPTSYMLLIMGRLYHEIMAGRGLKPSTISYGAAVFIVGTLMGAMAKQLKAIGQGRDPEDMTQAKFWAAAFMQSGGVGIFGDFIGSSINRFGGGLAQTIAGPVADRATTLLDLTAGNLAQYANDEKTNAGRELTKFLRQNTPGMLAPWYVRTAYERLIVDKLQELVDPDVHRSYRQRVLTNRKVRPGNEFYWPPGSASRPRLPDIGAAFGTK